MMYHLYTQPWICVKYLDGTKSFVGIETALKDAEKIEDIVSPEFHKDTVDFYCMPVYRLLSTIVMSAYYKPEMNFKAKSLRYRDELLQNGVYSDTVRAYLDKYRDRFDLFSEAHPFLQNKVLKDNLKVTDDISYRTWSIQVPGQNNPVFGKCRTIDDTKSGVLEQYSISYMEFAYMVLYLIGFGRTPMSAQYPENSIAGKAQMFVIAKGKTLAETICLNLVKLDKSARPDEDEDDVLYDRPSWEFDSIDDMRKFMVSGCDKNILFCTFCPTISIQGIPGDNGFINTILRIKKEPFGLPVALSKVLSETYFDSNAILTHKTNDKTGEISYSYKQYDIAKDSAFSMCINATSYVDGNYNCVLVDSIPDDIDCRMAVYYRVYDQYATSVLNIGCIDCGWSKTWLKLKDVGNHSVAEEYQSYYQKTRAELRRRIISLFGDSSPQVQNAVRQQSDFIEKDFFCEFTDGLGFDDVLVNAADRLNKATIKIFDDITTNTADIMMLVQTRNKMYGTLMKQKEKIK